MDRHHETQIDGAEAVTFYRDTKTRVRAVFVGDLHIKSTRIALIEKIRLANEEGVNRFLLDVENASPDFPPRALIDEVEFFADNTPKGIRVAYVSSELRLARHFMMIRAAAFAKGLEVEVFETRQQAEAWLER